MAEPDRRIRYIDPLRNLPTFVGDPLVDESTAMQHLEDFERYLVANELPWVAGTPDAGIRLVMQRFHLSLKGRARAWWEEEDVERIPDHPEVVTWTNIKNAFLTRFNPYGNTRESLIYEWENLQYKIDDDIEKFIERAKVIGAGLTKPTEEIVEKVRMKLPPPLGQDPYKFTLHNFADIIQTHNQMLHMSIATVAPQAVLGIPSVMVQDGGAYLDCQYRMENIKENEDITLSLKKIGKKISALTTSVNTVQHEVSYVNDHVNSVADTVYAVERQIEKHAEKQAAWQREKKSRERYNRGRYTPRGRSLSPDRKNNKSNGRSYSSGTSHSRSRDRSEQACCSSEKRERGRTFHRGQSFYRGDSSINSTDRHTWKKKHVSFGRHDQGGECYNGRDRHYRDSREGSPYHRPFQGTCDHCGGRGHMWRNCNHLQKEMIQKLSIKKDLNSERKDENTNYIGDFGSEISKGCTFGEHLSYAQVARQLDFHPLN